MNQREILFRTILQIISGKSSLEAVDTVSQQAGIDFNHLWHKLPERYKRKQT